MRSYTCYLMCEARLQMEVFDSPEKDLALRKAVGFLNQTPDCLYVELWDDKRIVARYYRPLTDFKRKSGMGW
jgi:hypothetical protein